MQFNRFLYTYKRLLIACFSTKQRT